MADVQAELEKLRLENASLRKQLSLLSSEPTPDLPSPNASATPTCNGHQGACSTAGSSHPSSAASEADLSAAPLTGRSQAGVADVCRPPWVAGASHSLTGAQIQRYSRHLLLPSFGIAAQERLAKGAVLIVGAGGLGSPVALYLAASGVGCLGIMDPDCVEVHNLHRQVIHSEASVGEAKVASAARACRAINSSLKVREYAYGLAAANALDIIPEYDVVVDASDNVATRYLVSDGCVVAHKPLVSGAALGMEGQLTVYNHSQGPCYRCLFPDPPPQAACQRCSDAGVLGVVPGIIGTLQALEVIKILSQVGSPLSSRMLIMDALSTRIHTVKLRGRNLQCTACGESPELDAAALPRFDYESFAASPMSDAAPPRQQVVGADEAVTCREYNAVVESRTAHVLLDVREPHEFAIASLPSSLNVPYARLDEQIDAIRTAATERQLEAGEVGGVPVYVICRRGNDSQRAVQVLRSAGIASVYDITGGLQSWVREVDPNFPAF